MAQLTDRKYVATLLPVDSFEERDVVLSREALDEAYRSLLCEQIDRVEQMLELVAVEARWHASLFYRLVRTRDRDDPDESDFCYTLKCEEPIMAYWLFAKLRIPRPEVMATC